MYRKLYARAWGSQLSSLLASRLVHQKVQKALGLDQARLMISAAAPIAPENLQFFTGLDLLIREVYGQSEDCGPTSISLAGSTRIGAVGKPLVGTEVRIAEDGEILVRGPHVFQGYMGRPDDTAQTLVDGWLHTGDLGRFDGDGYLYVSGRKKDLLITSGGKNISTANIEARQCVLAPFAFRSSGRGSAHPTPSQWTSTLRARVRSANRGSTATSTTAGSSESAPR